MGINFFTLYLHLLTNLEARYVPEYNKQKVKNEERLIPALTTIGKYLVKTYRRRDILQYLRNTTPLREIHTTRNS